MQDKNSVYNLSIGSKLRIGVQDFLLLQGIMYHLFMSLLQIVLQNLQKLQICYKSVCISNS